jgi:hypothetical protein
MTRIFIDRAPGCYREKLLVRVEWHFEGWQNERLDHVMLDDPDMVNQFLELNPTVQEIIKNYKRVIRMPKRNYYPFSK